MHRYVGVVEEMCSFFGISGSLSFVCGDTNLAVDGKVDAAAAALAIVAQSAKG